MTGITADVVKATANNWLCLNLGHMPYSGDPVLTDGCWRVPISLDFPMPHDDDNAPISFRNLGEIEIDAESGEVVRFPSAKEREERTIAEIGRALAEIHQGIPEFKCERCGRCCGPIGATKMEMDMIDEHVRRHDIEVPEYIQDTIFRLDHIVRTTDDLTCPYLKDNECMVYKVRPTICRLFGTVDRAMPCVAGGMIEKPFSLIAAFGILRRVDVLDMLWAATNRPESDKP